MRETQYWIGVVSHDHVQKGVEGGFAQLCHGKAAPLKRMQLGDWLIYYSPRTRFGDGEPYQAFTAIGRVLDEEMYSFAMTEDFCPFRRNIEYLPCHPASIHPLLDSLSFIADKKRWGYPFRRGHFSISREDFQRIAEAMGVDLSVVDPQLSAKNV